MTITPFKYLRLMVAALTAALTSGIVFAVPADPRPKKFTQPDGSVITVKIRGDERSHFYLSDDDYLLLRGDDGAFVYGYADSTGAIVSSGLLAREAGLRTVAEKEFLGRMDKLRMFEALERRASEAPSVSSPSSRGTGLFEGSHFPVIGKQKAIVVLVEYRDIKFNLEDPYDYFSRMLNEEGFSDYGGTGSARDFFLDNSCGLFEPEFDVYGPVELPKVRRYYGMNDFSGNDKYAYQMAIDACKLLDETVDFSEYDRDGDGRIDNVFIFFAGEGEASGGGADTVWPHSWDLATATRDVYEFDGVRLDRYGCTCEWSEERPDGVGTFIHEFSHVMGLPDLYSTSYSSAFTPGPWSTLDYGSYNNDGCTPPNYGAFERYALGWLDPLPITGEEDVTLRPVGENVARIIQSADPDEFFLLENRQLTGWDTYLPGHGMLIWHIHYDAARWTDNTVNNTARHQHVDIEEADGRRSAADRDGDAFPGAKGVTSFTDDTDPSMRLWNDEALNLPLTDIAEDSLGIITFKVRPAEVEGIADIIGADRTVRVDGRRVWVEAPAGASVGIDDMMGRSVGGSAADASGRAVMEVPAPGIYVVRTPGRNVKIRIKN